MRERIITDPAVNARLPYSGWHVQWQWFWFRRIADAACGRGNRDPFANWRDIRSCLFMRVRYANCRQYWVGPLRIVRPMPWLEDPARALHPEAFTDN